LYARVKMMASSREAGCWSVTSVQSGSPNPVMKSWIYCGLVTEVLRQDSVMKHLQNLSMVPNRRNMANSPMGLSINGGPKRTLMS
jgi:hypothetical protein